MCFTPKSFMMISEPLLIDSTVLYTGSYIYIHVEAGSIQTGGGGGVDRNDVSSPLDRRDL
jgi:hypothetical protein